MKKHVLSLFIAILLVVTLLPISVFAADSNGFTYNVVNGKAVITKYNKSGAVTIPATLGGYTVDRIENYAFYNNTNITSLSFASGSKLTSIGSCAFCNCSSIKGTLTIPKSVVTLETFAFGGCSGITALVFESGSNLNTIGKAAFQACTSISNKLIIPKSVKEIGTFAFAECIKIPGLAFESGIQLKEISNHAFQGFLALAGEVAIPDSVTRIGDYAFCPDSTFIEGFEYNTTATKLTFGKNSKLTTIGSCAFLRWDGLTELTLPDSVKSIGNDAFHSCRNLLDINLGPNITYIGHLAFVYTALYYYECDQFHNGVKQPALYIGNYLTTVNLNFKNRVPENFTVKDGTVLIADGAFVGILGQTNPNTKSKTVTIPDSVKYFGNGNTKSIFTYDDDTDGDKEGKPVIHTLTCPNMETIYGYNTRTEKMAQREGINFVRLGNGTVPDPTPTTANYFVRYTDDIYVGDLDIGGNTILAQKTYSAEVGKTVKATAVSIPGYSLVGASEKSIVVNNNENKNIITFVYKKVATQNPPVTTNYYTVTFVDWDGKTLKTQTVEEGKGATAPTAPTRDGYTFTGWDKDFSNVKSNITVKAVYKENTKTPTLFERIWNVIKMIFPWNWFKK